MDDAVDGIQAHALTRPETFGRVLHVRHGRQPVLTGNGSDGRIRSGISIAAKRSSSAARSAAIARFRARVRLLGRREPTERDDRGAGHVHDAISQTACAG